jgi:hypothetical protein
MASGQRKQNRLCWIDFVRIGLISKGLAGLVEDQLRKLGCEFITILLYADVGADIFEPRMQPQDCASVYLTYPGF